MKSYFFPEWGNKILQKANLFLECCYKSNNIYFKSLYLNENSSFAKCSTRSTWSFQREVITNYCYWKKESENSVPLAHLDLYFMSFLTTLFLGRKKGLAGNRNTHTYTNIFLPLSYTYTHNAYNTFAVNSLMIVHGIGWHSNCSV